mgnify:CR=1 FL=1
MEGDDFADLTLVFNQYIDYRKKIETDLGSKIPKKNGQQQTSLTQKPTEISKVNFNFPTGTTTTIPETKMEAPKPIFSFLGDKSKESGPKIEAPKTFNFLSKPSEVTEKKESSNPIFNFQGNSGAKPAFNFGSTSTLPAFKPMEVKKDDEDDEGGDDNVEHDDGGVPTINPEDFKTGEGEEDETTLWENEKVKLFTKEEDNWKEKGVGFIKVKLNNKTQSSRLLSRTEGLGKILLNCSIFKSMGVTKADGKKDVIINTIEEGNKIINYLVRFKAESDASSFKIALEKAKEQSKK